MKIKGIIRANITVVTASFAAVAFLALPSLSQDTELFTVPDTYQVEGISPIKKSDVDHLFYDPASIRSNLIWSADVKNRRLLVTDETNNVHLVAVPLSTPIKLTDRTVPEAVKMAPHGRSFAFTSDHEDEDNHNLYVYDFQNKRPQKLIELTGKDESIDSFVWDESGNALFYMRVDYDTKQSRLCRHDLVVEKCYPPQMKGTWDVLEAFKDRVLLKYFKGSSNQYLYLYNINTDKIMPLDEQGNCRKAAFGDAGKSVIWTSEGNQKCVTQPCVFSLGISRGRLGQVRLPSDSEYLIDVKVSPGGQRIMFQETRNGVDRLRVFPIKNGILGNEYRPFVPDAFVVWNTRWLSNDELAYTLENIGTPASIQSYDFRTKRKTDWTKERLPEQLREKVNPPQMISWKSFDGKAISGYAIRPKGNQQKLPVLIHVHGGPQILDKPIFNSQDVRLSANLGLTILHTNIRGSSGFGKDFMNADDREKRGDAINDVRALIDWIERQPDMDASRIYVRGGSYGGFVALATALQEPQRVKGVVAEYPLVSIRGYLNQSWIDEFAKTEYGDPKDNDLMARLDTLSPLGNTHRWNNIPVFLTRGKSDSRVPEKDVTDLKSQLQKKGADVWYIYSTQDGHGVSSRYVTAAMYQFLKKQINREK